MFQQSDIINISSRSNFTQSLSVAYWGGEVYKGAMPVKISHKKMAQWWIQDVPEVGPPTPKADVKSYYLANSLKLHEIERILTSGEGASLATP